MAERTYTTSFQIWESQDVAVNNIVNFENINSQNRQRYSRSTVIREALDLLISTKYPQFDKNNKK